jgi:hypothetical protein
MTDPVKIGLWRPKVQSFRLAVRSPTMPKEPPPAETPAELRAKAQHARALARNLPIGDELERRLREIAAELEAQADALERQKPP